MICWMWESVSREVLWMRNFEVFMGVLFLFILPFSGWLIIPLWRDYPMGGIEWVRLLWVWIYYGLIFIGVILVGGRMSILWGWGEGICLEIAIKSILLVWLMIVVDPGLGVTVVQVILRYFRWTEELIANFSRTFGGALVGEVVLIGGSLDWDFWARTWGRYISCILWISQKVMLL